MGWEVGGILKREGTWLIHVDVWQKPIYAGQEAIVRTTDWFKIGKGVWQGCVLSPCLISMQSTSCEMLGWMNNKIKIAGRNINNLRYADDTTLMAESKEELKSLLIKVREESEKAGLKVNTQKTKIMAFGPITSWQIDGEQVETVTDFIFLGSRITVDSDCTYEIKTLVPWKKIYNKPRQHIEKQKHHFEDKGSYIQIYGFSGRHVHIWELDHKEGWAPKNSAFKLCWRWLLRVSWTAQRSNQSILKEISPNIHWKDWCWSWSSNSLATWCEKLSHWKRPWFWEWLRAREEVGNRGWDGWLASKTQRTWVRANKLCEIVKHREAWCAAVHGVTKSWTWLREWTTKTTQHCKAIFLQLSINRIF